MSCAWEDWNVSRFIYQCLWLVKAGVVATVWQTCRHLSGSQWRCWAVLRGGPGGKLPQRWWWSRTVKLKNITSPQFPKFLSIEFHILYMHLADMEQHYYVLFWSPTSSRRKYLIFSADRCTTSCHLCAMCWPFKDCVVLWLQRTHF